MATLTSDISASQTVIGVSGSSRTTGHYRFRIDDELMDLQGFPIHELSGGYRQAGLDHSRWIVTRAVGGSTAATHSAGGTLKGVTSALVSSESETPPAPWAGEGADGGGVIVDNQDDPPAEVTTLIAPGAVIAGDEADMSDVVAVRKIVTTLTDAQIKTLPTTAVVVIPAPGANVAVVPLFCHLRCAAVADYTNIDPTSSISLNSFDSLALLTNDLQNAVTGLLAPGDADDAANAFISLTQLVNEGTIRLNGISSIYDSDASNEAVTMGADNAALGNFTGGNAANELTVTVLYVVLDLA